MAIPIPVTPRDNSQTAKSYANPKTRPSGWSSEVGVMAGRPPFISTRGPESMSKRPPLGLLPG